MDEREREGGRGMKRGKERLLKPKSVCLTRYGAVCESVDPVTNSIPGVRVKASFSRRVGG